METPSDKPEKDPTGTRMPIRGMAVWFLLLALFLLMFQMFNQGPEKLNKYTYTEFVKLVNDQRVRNAQIVMEVSGSRFVKGELLDLDEKTGKNKKYRVYLAETESLQKLLLEKGVQFEITPQNPYLWQILSGAIPFLLIMGLLYFMFTRQMRMAGKGAMSFGKSRAKLLTRGKNRITFADVAGINEAEEEVQEIVEFLKDPKRFQRLGGRIPKGVLLVGPPGTGKTLLAKAIAGEANVPFFSISGSDFVEMFVGVGASRVRDMFEQGRKNAPCIIFIDEIDAVGRSRFSGIGGGHDEREQTLNALLVEMDGFDTQEGVILIAATNRADVLDNALLRPGRFDRQIMVELPGLEGRTDILKIHTKRIKLSPACDLHRVARGTPGFSGADLSNLVNEAALLAARRGAESVEIQDMEEARDKVRWGRERRSRMLDDNEKLLTAYHEAGHAIVLALVEEAEPLHKVTIIPRGQSLGSTMQLPEKDRYTQGKRKLLGMLTGLMGGRAAEELACRDITTGASNDLKQATRIAHLMVCEWGMSGVLGPQSFGNREEMLFMGREVSRNQEYSEATAQKIDQEVNRLLTEAYQHALDLLRTHRDKLELITKLLIERETLDGRDVDELIKHGRILSDSERGPDTSGASPTPVAAVEPPAIPAAPGTEPPPVIGPSARPSLA